MSASPVSDSALEGGADGSGSGAAASAGGQKPKLKFGMGLKFGVGLVCVATSCLTRPQSVCFLSLSALHLEPESLAISISCYLS